MTKKIEIEWTQEDVERQEFLSEKARDLIEELKSKVVERDELSALLVLAIFSAQNIFLIGKPGVAKTKLIKVAMKAVKDAVRFEHLIRYDTKPETLFGERYRAPSGEIIHEKEYTVLDADYVFLDEIFKGDGRVTNGLLGVTSEEREYHPEGAPPVKVRLKTLFGVSNELPDKETLEALNDRFLLRMVVERIKEDENFMNMIQGSYDGNNNIKTEIFLDEVDFVSKEACANIIIQNGLAESYTALKHTLIHSEAVEASDRRLVGAIRNVMRVSAYLNNRREIDESDFFILEHIIWNNHNEREKTKKAVYRHMFSSVQYAEGLINDAKKAFSEISAYKQAKLNDFLAKKTIVKVEEKESYFQEHMGEIKKVRNALFANFSNFLSPAIAQFEKNKNILELCRQNIFVADKTDTVFTVERALDLQQVVADFRSLDSYLEAFLKQCPNPRKYEEYTGNIDVKQI